jgi:hypothetical protein
MLAVNLDGQNKGGVGIGKCNGTFDEYSGPSGLLML